MPVMSLELKVLMCSIVLGLIQLLYAANLATLERGLKWNLSPRDEKMPELSPAAAHASRAFHNFLETFPFFSSLILLTQVMGRNSIITSLGAVIYLICRVIYVPLYVKGIPGYRSLVWFGSMIGIATVFVGVLIYNF